MIDEIAECSERHKKMKLHLTAESSGELMKRISQFQFLSKTKFFVPIKTLHIYNEENENHDSCTEVMLSLLTLTSLLKKNG